MKNDVRLTFASLLMLSTVFVQGQLWREDYFKDEVMRFSTVECWQNVIVTPKEKGVTRLVFVGDSVTLGVGGKRSMMDFSYDYHFQMDGSKAGFQGYPYLVNQLFKNHNQSDVIQTINFSSDNFTLLTGPEGKTYKDTCEYRQLMSSEPDVVFAMLGAKESMNIQAFSPKAFEDAYKSFIAEMEGLPSKPMFFIIGPNYSAQRVRKSTIKTPFKLNQLDGSYYDLSQLESWQQNNVTMQTFMFDFVKDMDKPFDEYISSELYVADPERYGPNEKENFVDPIHLNEHGHGMIAQAIYMRLAYSKPFMMRHTMNMAQNKEGAEAQQMIDRLIEVPKFKHENAQMFFELDDLMNKPYRMAKQYHICNFDWVDRGYYNQIVPPKPNQLRVAFAGDSVTQGNARWLGDYWMTSMQRYKSDVGDGSRLNFGGFAYMMHNLLADKQPFDQPIDMAFLNYAYQGTQLQEEKVHHQYQDTCQYIMLQQSMPHAVFLGFGFGDTHLYKFTEEKFTQRYLALIKEMENLPTKPQVYIFVPVGQCEDYVYFRGAQAEMWGDAVDYKHPYPDACTGENGKSIRNIVLKVAKLAGIPDERVMNGWDMLKPTPELMDSDHCHPNEKGHQVLARTGFNMLSQNQELRNRVNQLANGTDDLYNKAVKAELDREKQGK